MTEPENRLCNVNELAAEIGHHRSYITDMKRAGFIMPGGRASPREARAWLIEHPNFRTNRRKKTGEVRLL